MRDDILGLTTLHDLIDYEGRKLTAAEKLIESVLPDWIKRASSLFLKTILQKYLGVVKDNLQAATFFIREEEVEHLSCINNVMQAFVLEAREKMSNCTDAEVLDASLLSSVQGINHYKIHMYGTVAAFAKALGNEKFAEIFHRAKLNEEQIDVSLSQLAEQEVNNRARTSILLSNNNN